MGIPIKDSEESEFTVTLPSVAQGLDILCGGMGIGSLQASENRYEEAHAPGAVLTGVIDLGIPGFFLCFGLTSNMIESEGKALIAKLATWLAETFAGIAVRGGLFAGGYSQDAMGTSWATEIINSLIKETPSVLADLLAWAAAVSAEEALEEALPIVGAVWEAISVTATVAELAETVTDIVLSPWVIPTLLTATMSIQVTIKPDVADYEFPAQATQYKLVAHLTDTLMWDTGWLPFNGKDFDPKTNKFPMYTFTNIPAGGQVEVTVQFAAADFWVAAYGTTGKVSNLVEEGQDKLALDVVIKENPVPLSKTTVYTHMRKLGINAGGSHYWIQTAAAPTATRAQLGGNMAVTLEDLAHVTFNMHGTSSNGHAYNVGVLGYVWQGKSPTLTVCGAGGGASTPLYTLQSIELGTATPDSLLKILPCGFTAPLMLAYDLLAPATGGHFIVAQTQDGTDSSGKPQFHYHVRKLDLSQAGPINLAGLPSWGRFASPKIGSIAAHGEEFVLALSPD
ncbi:MAG: hypothetical protein ACREJU_20175, partial [Nitrospiraceae bacterium]